MVVIGGNKHLSIPTVYVLVHLFSKNPVQLFSEFTYFPRWKLPLFQAYLLLTVGSRTAPTAGMKRIPAERREKHVRNHRTSSHQTRHGRSIQAASSGAGICV